ncbi:hypothetical protein AJ87_11520 [Rhizobium yanglingense]|nr:hypothetical protein AJ87_11520 [Rhizobium yanglingense]
MERDIDSETVANSTAALSPHAQSSRRSLDDLQDFTDADWKMIDELSAPRVKGTLFSPGTAPDFRGFRVEEAFNYDDFTDADWAGIDALSEQRVNKALRTQEIAPSYGGVRLDEIFQEEGGFQRGGEKKSADIEAVPGPRAVLQPHANRSPDASFEDFDNFTDADWARIDEMSMVGPRKTVLDKGKRPISTEDEARSDASSLYPLQTRLQSVAV